MIVRTTSRLVFVYLILGAQVKRKILNHLCNGDKSARGIDEKLWYVEEVLFLDFASWISRHTAFVTQRAMCRNSERRRLHDPELGLKILPLSMDL